jgi:3'(2'), 5'-bisphosphate nucleotidase
MNTAVVIDALRRQAPPLMRWGGAVARRLRKYNIALGGKHSGSAATDALTLADISVQELIVAGLRDGEPILRQCRIEAEETSGDLAAFDENGPLTIALDPIDGTKQFRDHTGDGYCVMLHLRNKETVLYSLVYVPEATDQGLWVEAYGEVVKTGPDNWKKTANECLETLAPVDHKTRPDSKSIYLIGFQSKDAARANDVTAAGLKGVAPDDMPGSIYPLLASGQFGGSLIHSPNVYDYPVSMQIARALGGESVWVHNGQPVNFNETWMDDRADMVRLPGIVATAVNPQTLKTLVELAKDWNPVRYAE